jgi:hypothetical protein
MICAVGLLNSQTRADCGWLIKDSLIPVTVNCTYLNLAKQSSRKHRHGNGGEKEASYRGSKLFFHPWSSNPNKTCQTP